VEPSAQIDPDRLRLCRSPGPEVSDAHLGCATRWLSVAQAPGPHLSRRT
jgi:hypothetical protein